MKPGTALKMSGVETRWVVDGENAAQMGAKAARAALSNGGLDWSEIDAIVGTSGTPDQPIPCNAALIQEELGLGESGIPSFDINTTCMSFLAGFDLVSYLIEAGRFRKVLLVSSDIPSCGLNPKQIEAYCLFGDAAVAVVVGPSGKDESSRIHASRLETYASGAHTCEVAGGGTRLHATRYNAKNTSDYLFSMDGPGVFKQASHTLPKLIKKVLADSGFGLDEIQVAIPHQASSSAMELMRRRLDIPPEKWMVTVQDYGNTIAASIPLALDEAIRQGKLTRGGKAIFVATSAGFSIGAMTFTY
jgi:3-oxoacyl-[acyl-carrier-protein] synthase-3